MRGHLSDEQVDAFRHDGYVMLSPTGTVSSAWERKWIPAMETGWA